MHSRVHFDFYQWETLLKELEKLAAIFKNYLKKRQFYKVNSYLQIWLISKTCQGRNYIHRNSCSLAMKASSTCSYAVTLRLLSLVHRCCQYCPRQPALCYLFGHLSSPLPYALICLPWPSWVSFICSSLRRLEMSVLMFVLHTLLNSLLSLLYCVP